MGKLLSYQSKPSIYGTGLIALDIVISADPSIPTRQWAGGTCGNVLTILSLLGWDSYPIARLNSNAVATIAKNDLKKWKVNLNFASLQPTATLPVITQENIRDASGASRHKFHWRNCPKCGAWLPNYRPITIESINEVKQKVSGANVFFFDRVSPAALELARFFKSLGSLIYFEPSAKANPQHFKKAIEYADIVKYSEQRFPSKIASITKKNRPFLEIQTLGAKGLRYRTRKKPQWMIMPAFQIGEVVDSCGSGDWTTAGIISALCYFNRDAFLSLSERKIQNALKFAQALGAWNCNFEGARGGMYEIQPKAFLTTVLESLKKGKKPKLNVRRKPTMDNASDGFCPACPQVGALA